MGKYLKKFTGHTPYDLYINSESKILPNVSICKQEKHVHYNPKPKPIVPKVITFMDRGSVYSSDTQTAAGSVTFTAPAAPATSWAEHTFMGWSENAYPAYSEIGTSTVKQPGSTITISTSTTFYAVYQVTVQGLIDEGYAAPVTGNGGTYIRMLSTCPYKSGNIVDISEVAANTKKLTGTTNNTILWNDDLPSGWTGNDVADIYDGLELQFVPRPQMFWAVGEDVDNFSVSFGGGDWSVNDYPWGSYSNSNGTFAPRSDGSSSTLNRFRNAPKNVTVTIRDLYGSIGQVMFCEMRTTETLTINMQGVFICHDVTGIFEDDFDMRVLNMNLMRYDVWRTCHNAFLNCSSLLEVPYQSAWGRDSVYNTIYPRFDGTRGSANCEGIFDGCSSLQTIWPTINMNATSLSGCTADGQSQGALGVYAGRNMFYCPNLTNVRIKNLNNNDWNFSDGSTKTYIPNMDADSIDYLLNNVVDCSANPHTVTFSNTYQSSVSQSAISNAQSKGWTVAFAS